MKKDLEALFIKELREMYDAEHQITKALPKMVKAAHSSELKKAFSHHLSETKKQVRRLEQVFKILGIAKKKAPSIAIKGLIKEGGKAIKSLKSSPLRDAALINKAQHIEHWEMASYGTLCAFAKELRLNPKIASLLHETFDEEEGADNKLTKIAKGTPFKTGVNCEAKRMGDFKKAAGW